MSKGSSWQGHDAWWCWCITNQLVKASDAMCPRCGQSRPPEADRPKTNRPLFGKDP